MEQEIMKAIKEVLIENLTRKESAIKTFNQLNKVPILFELAKT